MILSQQRTKFREADNLRSSYILSDSLSFLWQPPTQAKQRQSGIKASLLGAEGQAGMAEARGCNRPIVHQAFLHCVPSFKLCTLQASSFKCAHMKHLQAAPKQNFHRLGRLREKGGKTVTICVTRSRGRREAEGQSVSHDERILCHTTQPFVYLCICVFVYLCIWQRDNLCHTTSPLCVTLHNLERRLNWPLQKN